MKFSRLHDKEEIERFLRGNVYLHIYSIGDLDDFFWPHTAWYGLRENGRIEAVALIYTGQALPTLLALSDKCDVMRELVASMSDVLPEKFYAHLSPGVEAVLCGAYDMEAHGEHWKMGLKDRAAVFGYDCSDVVNPGPAEEDEILRFYEQSYPGNWFDARMLETGQYFGIRKGGVLVSVAGVHVYSATYGVAALGNIATLPSQRGRGYGTAVTARLCQSLSSSVEQIGLNVKADNSAAISCYRKLGFERVAAYGEFVVRRKDG